MVRMGRANTSAAVPTKAKKKQRDNQSLELEYSQLKEENRKLRDLAEWRSATMAHLAHELRTPLTSILGFSEILLGQEQLTDAQRNFCERIQNSAQQLQRTLNHMADLSRMDTPSDYKLPST